MLINKKTIQTILPVIFFVGCSQISINNSVRTNLSNDNYTIVKTGLDILMEKHLDKLNGKNVALVTNHSGLDMFEKSNVSRFMEHDSINLVKIFTPEHGFTGMIADGDSIESDTTSKVLPPIISLYGKSRKPTLEMYKNIDLIIYDIQDVGTRVYTYISTLGLIMETAGEANIPVMILDRPNPIGNKVEGPVLDINHKSFIGQYPIPIRYGMTVGELGNMIVGEKMINPISDLIVIPMENYESDFSYDDTKLPWVKPSPNIVDLETAFTYPGQCLVQGTNVSDGRGTYTPLKRVGAPWINSEQLINRLENEKLEGVNFITNKFTPVPIPSMAVSPKFQDRECFGVDLNITNRTLFNSVQTGVTILYHLNKMYPDSISIKQKSIARIWGSDSLFIQIQGGKTPTEIINYYQAELEQFKLIREKYLIYQ